MQQIWEMDDDEEIKTKDGNCKVGFIIERLSNLIN
jgi:hypothetical protein